MLFGYFGPDSLLPATSGLLALAGGCLLFGKTAIQLTGDLIRRAFRRPAQPAAVPPRPQIARRRASRATAPSREA